MSNKALGVAGILLLAGAPEQQQGCYWPADVPPIYLTPAVIQAERPIVTPEERRDTRRERESELDGGVLE